jgi:hypothetical protein
VGLAKRLQVHQLTASTVAAGNWQLNFYYCPSESLLCNTNNGNIVRQKGYGGAAWDYTYDSLNHLELTTEKVGTVDKWQPLHGRPSRTLPHTRARG